MCTFLFLSNYSGVYAYIPSTFLIFFLTQSRLEFEGDLIEQFGSLVKMPLLKADRYCLPNKWKIGLFADLWQLHLHQLN